MFVINTVTISGNATRDPELRSIPSGTSVCALSIAVNERIKKGETWEDRPSFIDVTAWGSLGEQIAKQVSKGQMVVVMGQLRQDRWEKDGNKHSKVQIIARAFVTPKTGSNGQSSTEPDIPFDSDGLQPAASVASDDDIPFT